MELSRRTQIRILRVLNQLIPPIVRDAEWFMRPLMRLAFRHQVDLAMAFKDRAYSMTPEEFLRAYEEVGEVSVTKDTDLNRECHERILVDALGTVLEVGCGKGALAVALHRRHPVTACDIVIDPFLAERHPGVIFRTADAEQLPFRDGEFDTVVCTHTLEHVRDLSTAISELRRVARSRMIIVVPMERPYRYTFNFHLHFFPYPHSLSAVMGVGRNGRVEVLGGDLYYVEELAGP